MNRIIHIRVLLSLSMLKGHHDRILAISSSNPPRARVRSLGASGPGERKACADQHAAHAFADYVAQAQRDGVEHYPLYRWTRETIENPAKKAKYLEAFTLYVNGDEVYDKALADALEADLQSLRSDAIIDIRKFDTNPAHNPQPPSYNNS
jgi:hypothetical protein